MRMHIHHRTHFRRYRHRDFATFPLKMNIPIYLKHTTLLHLRSALINVSRRNLPAPSPRTVSTTKQCIDTFAKYPLKMRGLLHSP